MVPIGNIRSSLLFSLDSKDLLREISRPPNPTSRTGGLGLAFRVKLTHLVQEHLSLFLGPGTR